MKKLLSLACLALLSLATACSKEKLCASDETLVQDTCYALKSDPRNCGTVGNACQPGQGCSVGACVDCASNPGVCAAAVLAACANLDQVRPLGADLAPSGQPLPTAAGPISIASEGSALYVANSSASTISTFTVAASGTTAGSAIPVSTGGAGFGDLEHLAAHGGLLWASNAATGTLVVLDPATGQAVDEVVLAASAGEFVNPQGIAFADAAGKAYVALAGVNALAVVDLTATPRKVMKRIDLSGLAFAGAQAAPSRVLAVPLDPRLFVTLNDVYDASYQRVDGAHGRLAVIDAVTDTVSGDAIDLGAGCLNASGLALEPSGKRLWVGCGWFDLFGTKAVLGGALVPVDITGAAPTAGTPIPLADHAADSVAFCGGAGYAGASDSGTVLKFDPASGAVSSALACPPASADKLSYVPDVACAP